MGLKGKVEQWLAEGLITPEQGKAILKKEEAQRPGAERWLYGFLLVAVFSTGIGVIALIATNWHAIPSLFKLAVYFALLCGAAAMALKAKRENRGSWFESLLILFMILCMAGIGLISQIYNIKGESYQALFFWSLMTFSLLPLTRKSLADHLWIGGFFTGFSTWGASEWSADFFYKAALLQPLAFFLLFMLCHNKSAAKAIPPLKLKREALGVWTICAGLTSLAVFHISPRSAGLAAPDFFLLGAAAIFVFASVRFSDFKKIQKILMLSLLFLFFLLYLLRFSFQLDSLALMIFSSLQLSLLALLAASLKKKSLFVFFVAAFILRILFFYIAVFKSLALTGLILILMGCAIAGAVQSVRKNREKLLLWAERLNY